MLSLETIYFSLRISFLKHSPFTHDSIEHPVSKKLMKYFVNSSSYKDYELNSNYSNPGCQLLLCPANLVF